MKRFTILISLLFVLFSCGCGNSFTSPKEVTFAFIEESGMVKQTASVVSILSSGRVYTGSDSYSTTRVLSGVILNEEGYILTSSEACNFDVSDNGTIYEGKFTNAYAVLSDVYQDQRHYILNLVDNHEEAGLALFRFQTDFYYENLICYNAQRIGRGAICCCKFSECFVQTTRGNCRGRRRGWKNVEAIVSFGGSRAGAFFAAGFSTGG